MKKSLGIYLFILLFFPTELYAVEPLKLQQCYKKALAYSDQVAISDQEIQLARARFTEVLGEILPQITFRISELLQDPAGERGENDAVGRTFTQLSRTTGRFNFRQAIFRGFQEFQALKINRLNQTRAGLDKEDVERLLFQDVAIAFYTVALIERDIESDRMIIRVVQKRIRELKERVELGKSREGELTQEEALLALLEAGLERKKGERSVAYEMMSFLTGLDPMPPIQWKDPIGDAKRSLAYYLNQVPTRPDLKAANTTIEIAKREVKVVKGDFLPRVDLEANVYTFRPGFQSDIHWDAEFVGEVPIFKYQNFGRLKEAKIEVKKSELEAQELLRVANREVKESYDQYISSREQYRRYLQATRLAYQNFQLQNEDFKLGRATNLDVLTAQRTWLESLDQRNRSQVQSWLDWTQLQIASGVMP